MIVFTGLGNVEENTHRDPRSSQPLAFRHTLPPVSRQAISGVPPQKALSGAFSEALVK